MAFQRWAFGNGRLPVVARTAGRGDRFGPAFTLPRLLARAGLSLLLSGVFAWLLADRMARIDLAALAAAVRALHLWQWLLALGFTGLSFWAVGQYDGVIHRHFATGLPPRVARRAGIAAIAVSQTLGLGLISGAILRWRMLPGLSLWQATRLTAAVALSFLAGWAVVTSATLLVLPGAPFRPLAGLALAVLLGLALLSCLGPRWPGLPVRWPNGFVLSRLVGLCAIDTLAAALAFHLLLPVGADLALTVLLPAFLLAFGAGLTLGTPGGMGAFEVTLLALLPVQPQPDLLVAILAWRMVYYVLPALVGAALAVAGPGPASPPPAGYLPHAPQRAETGLRHQGTLALAAIGEQSWLLGRSGHCLFAVFDPEPHRRPETIDAALLALGALAASESRLPAVYKASARTAARARALGFAPRRIGREAWLDPASAALSAPARSGLRRKLRRAAAAGVTVRQMSSETAPWRNMDDIAARWARDHGGERGFSVGRHARGYLCRQRLYVAWQAGHPIAYASFHAASREWTLDLMRHGADLPDGTMHSLVQAAIEDARQLGIARVSLAAVPEAAFGPGGRLGRILAALCPDLAATGLLRFKSAFAPHWSPRYLIAAHPAGLPLTALSLWRAITRPPPLAREIEQDHADYGFATAPGPWHIAERTD
ncbi:phosphatidylglycerol lysyltransferase domain-containing protein [Tabrizicola oligotrophica]|uniref:DUF2156 domain-containing protein n=1 Tax=Tabrizicola oligotrophica TaxID=2710650 RepID=A0A6M0QXD4_9RHOB|nr:phosphatidylglycerol lysyltransferase domain-containing protein [Tabrizicola oligotrophica]NEY91363.1 DUF2156 domain-containing protein [Tabrizicola oligotrophica]